MQSTSSVIVWEHDKKNIADIIKCIILFCWLCLNTSHTDDNRLTNSVQAIWEKTWFMQEKINILFCKMYRTPELLSLSIRCHAVHIFQAWVAFPFICAPLQHTTTYKVPTLTCNHIQHRMCHKLQCRSIRTHKNIKTGSACTDVHGVCSVLNIWWKSLKHRLLRPKQKVQFTLQVHFTEFLLCSFTVCFRVCFCSCLKFNVV